LNQALLKGNANMSSTPLTAPVAPWAWQTLEGDPSFGLKGPVGPGLIASASQAWGHALPPPLCDVYQHHNGQRPAGRPLFQDEYRWLSLEEALQEWRVWQDTMAQPDMAGMRDTHESCGAPDAAVRMDWWCALWWPLAVSANSNLLCLDARPGPTGHVHQIIEVSSAHEGRLLIAPSLDVLFANAVADMQGDLSD
jgi:cell wall assembly regulator SMI1